MHKLLAALFVLFVLPLEAMDPDDRNQEPCRVWAPVENVLPVLRSGAPTRLLADCTFHISGFGPLTTKKSTINFYRVGVWERFGPKFELPGDITHLAESEDGKVLAYSACGTVVKCDLAAQQTNFVSVATLPTDESWSVAVAEVLHNGLVLIGRKDGQTYHLGAGVQNMGKLFPGRIVRCAALIPGRRPRVAAVTVGEEYVHANFGFSPEQRLDVVGLDGGQYAQELVPGQATDIKVIEHFPGRPELLVLNHDGDIDNYDTHVSMHNVVTARKTAELRLSWRVCGTGLAVSPTNEVFAIHGVSRTQIYDARSLLLLSNPVQPACRDFNDQPFFAQGPDKKCYLLGQNGMTGQNGHRVNCLDIFQVDLPYLWENQKRHVMPNELEEARIASHSAVCKRYGGGGDGIVGALMRREIVGTSLLRAAQFPTQRRITGKRKRSDEDTDSCLGRDEQQSVLAQVAFRLAEWLATE